MNIYYIKVERFFRNMIEHESIYKDKNTRIRQFKKNYMDTNTALLAIKVNNTIYYVIETDMYTFYLYKKEDNYYPCAIILQGERFKIKVDEQENI